MMQKVKIERPGDAVSTGYQETIRKANFSELKNDTPPLPNSEYKPKSEIIPWTFTPIGQREAVTVHCFPYHPELEHPPEFNQLIIVEKAGVVDDHLKEELVGVMYRSKDGIIRAAMLLEKHLDFSCSRPDCLIAVKRFKEYLQKKNIRAASGYDMVVPLTDMVWIEEKSVPFVINEPGVKVHNSHIKKAPLVESKINWPDKISDEASAEMMREFDAEAMPSVPKEAFRVDPNRRQEQNLPTVDSKYPQKPKRVSTIRKPG